MKDIDNMVHDSVSALSQEHLSEDEKYISEIFKKENLMK